MDLQQPPSQMVSVQVFSFLALLPLVLVCATNSSNVSPCYNKDCGIEEISKAFYVHPERDSMNTATNQKLELNDVQFEISFETVLKELVAHGLDRQSIAQFPTDLDIEKLPVWVRPTLEHCLVLVRDNLKLILVLSAGQFHVQMWVLNNIIWVPSDIGPRDSFHSAGEKMQMLCRVRFCQGFIEISNSLKSLQTAFGFEKITDLAGLADHAKQDYLVSGLGVNVDLDTVSYRTDAIDLHVFFDDKGIQAVVVFTVRMHKLSFRLTPTGGTVVARQMKTRECEVFVPEKYIGRWISNMDVVRVITHPQLEHVRFGLIYLILLANLGPFRIAAQKHKMAEMIAQKEAVVFDPQMDAEGNMELVLSPHCMMSYIESMMNQTLRLETNSPISVRVVRNIFGTESLELSLKDWFKAQLFISNENLYCLARIGAQNQQVYFIDNSMKSFSCPPGSRFYAGPLYHSTLKKVFANINMKMLQNFLLQHLPTISALTQEKFILDMTDLISNALNNSENFQSGLYIATKGESVVEVTCKSSALTLSFINREDFSSMVVIRHYASPNASILYLRTADF